MQNLGCSDQSMGHLIQQHVDLEESSKAFNELFPPANIFGNEQQILEDVNNIGYN